MYRRITLAVLGLCFSLSVAQANSNNLKPEYDSSHRKMISVSDPVSGEVLKIDRPLWSLELGNGSVISSEEFRFVEKVDESYCFTHEKSGMSCSWSSPESKGEKNYLRHTFSFGTDKPVDVVKVNVLHLPGSGFRESGSVLGSPLVSRNWFAAMEYPMAYTILPSPSSSLLDAKRISIGKWSRNDLGLFRQICG